MILPVKSLLLIFNFIEAMICWVCSEESYKITFIMDHLRERGIEEMMDITYERSLTDD